MYTWSEPAAATSIFESLDPFLDMFNSLKSMCSGTARPTTDLIEFMMVVATTTNPGIWQRNAANSAWVQQGIIDQPFWGLDLYAAKIKTMTADAESGGDMIRTHIDVEDRGGTQDVLSRRVVEVWVAATEYAAPSATGNTVSFNKGTVIQELVANAHYRVLSDADGEIELDLTVSGAATRFVMASLPNAPVVTKELTFAA